MHHVYNKNYYIHWFCLSACETKREEEPFIIPDAGTLEKIERRGILNVCTYYNTTDYYVYKGIPKGFHYDLVKDLADFLDVKLHIEVNSNVEDCLRELNEGKYDLVAMSLSVTDGRKAPDTGRRQADRRTRPARKRSLKVIPEQEHAKKTAGQTASQRNAEETRQIRTTTEGINGNERF